ncbi:MAG: hypothetical protein KGL45_12220 [Gammaproteobacteria bacterium]|nr:hypothetical protein [Gammaproteobacteria bacterium]
MHRRLHGREYVTLSVQLLERDHGVVMPRRMQVEFSAVVQAHADAAESEIASSELWSLFQPTYLCLASDVAYADHHLYEVAGATQGIELELQAGGRRVRLRGKGNGPIAATVDALGLPLRIDAYEERSLGRGADASALAIVEAARTGVAGTRCGVGVHANIVTASVLAVLSAAARLGVTAADLVDGARRAGPERLTPPRASRAGRLEPRKAPVGSLR